MHNGLVVHETYALLRDLTIEARLSHSLRGSLINKKKHKKSKNELERGSNGLLKAEQTIGPSLQSDGPSL